MILRKWLAGTVSDDFVIIDSQFPQKEPFGFRNIEVSAYLNRFAHVSAYNMYPMSPGPEAWFAHGYGNDEATYQENKKGYLDHYPANAERIHHLDPSRRYKFKMAYSFFLAETYVLLPFYEKHGIPFIFMLYPGGAFGINNEGSDAMLRRIVQSPCFRKVIVSQQLTRDYLIDKRICPPEDIEYVYGGFVQFKKGEVRPKRLYKKDKSTFDICFVAAKYTEKGVDKGYDIFIKTAKILAKKTKDVHFHVVGNFEPADINIKSLGKRITFYGYQKSDFFPEFYSRMDIMLSPNRPARLYEGNFDGFPLGVDAGFCGTAMFVSDELKMNRHFTHGEDIVIVPLNPSKIAESILGYYNNVEELYLLSKKGKRASHKFFSIDRQLEGRIAVFNDVYRREYGENIS